MTDSMRDSLTDLQADLNSLQGDVVWMRALVKRAKGEVAPAKPAPRQPRFAGPRRQPADAGAGSGRCIRRQTRIAGCIQTQKTALLGGFSI